MKLQITIAGKAYEVDVEVLEDEDTSPELAHEAHHPAPPASGGAWDAEGKVCRSPVIGLVIKVRVEPGQRVEASAPIMVLEAMKMETHVTAPRAATVRSIHVKAGDSVKLGQVLVELD